MLLIIQVLAQSPHDIIGVFRPSGWGGQGLGVGPVTLSLASETHLTCGNSLESVQPPKITVLLLLGCVSCR